MHSICYKQKCTVASFNLAHPVEYFEYFCQMSSKSILIILSYTVSKFARFFLRHVWRYLKSSLRITQRVWRVSYRSTTPQCDGNPTVRGEHGHHWQQVDNDVEERCVGDTETSVWEVFHTDL